MLTALILSIFNLDSQKTLIILILILILILIYGNTNLKKNAVIGVLS